MYSTTNNRGSARWCKILVVIACFCLTYCKKLADTPVPTDQIAENAVYSNDATAIAVLSGLYASMNLGPFQGSQSNTGSIAINTGLSADEFSITAPFATSNSIFFNYYQNTLSQFDISALRGAEHWEHFYKAIFRCNAAIAGLTSAQANSLTQAVRQQLLGEAKFMRAFLYFHLVNEFGDVPLLLTTDPQIGTNSSRSPQSDVYQQMIEDLIDAEEKLNSDFLDITLLSKTNERVRPTKWAAAALLARAYLYVGDYVNAEDKATYVINNTGLFGLLTNLNDVFLKNSREAIWQIQPIEQNLNTREGLAFIIPPTGPSGSGTITNPVYLSTQILNSFEANDKRKTYGNWVDTTIYKLSSNPLKYDTVPFVYKYKVSAVSGVTTVGNLKEYFMVLRLAEQYLIRAESRAQLGKIDGAQADLNAIRNRAGLTNTTASDKTSLLTAIFQERRVELFAEGHRWFDLKRTGTIDAVMSSVTPVKTNGTAWQSFQQLFPIPLKDIQASPNLTQNPGY